MEHDDVFHAQVIIGHSMVLPLESLISGRKVFNSSQLVTEINLGLLQHVHPFVEENITQVLIKVSRISEECTGKNDVTNKCIHLLAKAIPALFPAIAFNSK
jgi:hypothetical protein